MKATLLRVFVAVFIACCAWNSVTATEHSETLIVTAGYSQVTFNARTGQPKRWVLCQTLCETGDTRRAVVFDDADGGIDFDSPFYGYEVEIDETEEAVTVRFIRAPQVYEYRLSRTTPEVGVSIPVAEGLSLFSGSSFVPQSLPGLGQMYSRVHIVQVSDAGQDLYPFEEDEPEVHSLAASADNWTGVRNRYWAFLVQPLDSTLDVVARYTREDHPLLLIKPPADVQSLDFRLYAGPVEWASLASVAPELSEMLFAALWDFLRWLTFGMMILLDWLYALVGHYGFAIVLLSLSAKILMSPLTMLADRWQSDVNRIQSFLKPELDKIKQNFKGEKAHQLTLDLYKKHDVSMFYTFKSAAGFLIQIPVFIAAFDMLAENIALNEIAFIWMSDLAKPDHFVELPFVLPFFGGWLNLLPFLMTGLSTLAAWLQAEESLTPELQRQQSIRLYGMAAAFFVLFYTFPAGMVLYWTSSNLFHLIKVESGRLFKRG